MISQELRIALFPGSFDPFTIGHFDIVERALPLFDEIVIAIGNNTNKSGFFSIEDRIKWIKQAFKGEPKVKVESYSGLTVDFCNRIGAKFLLRGLRTSSDFEYERAIAQMNKKMYPYLESVFLLTRPEHTPISSTIVRDIIRHGGDASEFLPKGIVIKSSI
jgi:pantetheine-phosphate adenylyltransferase